MIILIDCINSWTYMRTLHLLYVELIVIGVCLFYIQDTHMCLIYKVARFNFFLDEV